MNGSPPSAPSSASAPPALRCELALEQAALGSNVVVRMTLANAGEQDAWFLTWNTPFEGSWLGTVFTITRDGEELAYQGPMVKRAPPAGEDYQRVAAGRSAAAMADLARVYPFDQPGSYEIRVTGALHDVVWGSAPSLPREPPLSMPLDCAALRLTLPRG